MAVEYAPHGLIGVLTPQANTTVEPEFWVMLPPGVAMINARMMSDRDTLEGRLLDYFEQLDTAVRQFHNAPIGAIALGTTGASYVAGIPREREAVAALDQENGRAVHHRRACGGARAQHAEGESASASCRLIPRG